MSAHWMKPKYLSRFLRESLDNGHYRLTYREIAIGVSGRRSLTKAEVTEVTEEIRRCWHAAEKRLRNYWEVCAILVTKFYFDTYDKGEPRGENSINLCIALNGRPAAGVRLLCLKGIRNDPMAIMYFRMREHNVHGIQSAILDRIAIESAKGRLTPSVARTLVDIVSEPALPEHDAEFARLMEGEKK
jgi:hypothetical protein